MPRKPKFKPEITRVKLNPEQAVLSCGCYSHGHRVTGAVHGTGGFIPMGPVYLCHVSGGKSDNYGNYCHIGYADYPEYPVQSDWMGVS